MCAFLCLAEVKFGTASNNIKSMFYEVMNQVLEVEHHRATLYKGYIVDAERRLQFGVFEQLVEYNICNCIALDVDNDTHTNTAVGFVVDIRNTFYLLVGNEVSDMLDKFGLVDHIRNFGNHDAFVTAFRSFDFGLRAYDNASVTCCVSLANTVDTIYNTTGREIGSLDYLSKFIDFDFGVVNIGDCCIDCLSKVVRSHVGCHTYGDTVSTVDNQVRYFGRQYARFLQRIVEVVYEIYSFLVHIGHHLVRNLRQASLGVTHSSGAVAVNRTEVTLTIDESISHYPVLGEPYHCKIN